MARDIQEVIKLKIPGKRHGHSRDYLVEDHGDGQESRITQWDAAAMGVPQPDEATLDQWRVDVAAAKAARDQRRQNKEDFRSGGKAPVPGGLVALVARVQEIQDALIQDE